MTLTPKLPVLKPPVPQWNLWSVANHNLPTPKHFWEPPAGIVNVPRGRPACLLPSPSDEVELLPPCPATWVFVSGLDVIINLCDHTISLGGSCGEAE